jgi:haloacetate dehalogenase
MVDRREFLSSSAALALSAMSPSDSTTSQTEASTMSEDFSEFERREVRTSGAVIHTLVGGSGPPLLLLHGFPQTHVEWHKMAADLARFYTVVLTDLRGYGASSKPESGEDHSGYSKRAMAQDQVEVMQSLGHERFFVVGHDRGGRVAHRMALDHPDRVVKLAVLDIVPTYKLFHPVTQEFATAYYHWFFLIQPPPFPETLLANSLNFWLSRAFSNPKAFTPSAVALYKRAMADPETLHAACEDYRAAASIDLVHDEADLSKKIDCPLLALWGERASMHRLYDVLSTWRERATQVTGKPMPGGHYLPEELPEETLRELRAFLT